MEGQVKYDIDGYSVTANMIGSAVAGVVIASSPQIESLLVGSTILVGMGLLDFATGFSKRFGDVDDETEPDREFDFVGEGMIDDSIDDDPDDEFGDLEQWTEEDEQDGPRSDPIAELEPRINELENEVEDLSSSISTVRSENQAIGESVEDIEDNIRRLLNVYELVTEGANPFVDEVQDGDGEGHGSFGLFDRPTDGDRDTANADVNSNHANPDDFFQEASNIGDDEEGDGEMDDIIGNLAEERGVDLFEEGAEFGTENANEGETETKDVSKTFDDLKSEYQSDETEQENDKQSVRESDSIEADAESDEGVAEQHGEGITFENEVKVNDGEAVEAQDETGGVAGKINQAEKRVSDSTAQDEKPYLESISGGYASELLLIEWLTYLKRSSDISETFRAINYYENIGWIGGPVANRLQRYLSGFEPDEKTESTGGTQLTVDHHTESLQYIGRLGGTAVDVKGLEWCGPSSTLDQTDRRWQRGIQR